MAVSCLKKKIHNKFFTDIVLLFIKSSVSIDRREMFKFSLAYYKVHSSSHKFVYCNYLEPVKSILANQYFVFNKDYSKAGRERGGVVVVSDSESRGPGFDPHRRHHVVSLSKTH